MVTRATLVTVRGAALLCIAIFAVCALMVDHRTRAAGAERDRVLREVVELERWVLGELPAARDAAAAGAASEADALARTLSAADRIAGVRPPLDDTMAAAVGAELQLAAAFRSGIATALEAANELRSAAALPPRAFLPAIERLSACLIAETRTTELPTEPQLHGIIGEALLSHGRPDLAVVHLRIALTADFDGAARVRVRLAEALVRLDRPEAALRMVDSVRRSDSPPEMALTMAEIRAVALRTLGRHEEATEPFRRRFELRLGEGPASVSYMRAAALDLAENLVVVGRWQDAESLLRDQLSAARDEEARGDELRLSLLLKVLLDDPDVPPSERTGVSVVRARIAELVRDDRALGDAITHESSVDLLLTMDAETVPETVLARVVEPSLLAAWESAQEPGTPASVRSAAARRMVLLTRRLNRPEEAAIWELESPAEAQP